MYMIKTTATQFKAKLGRYMRAVREGKDVMITDRDQPVARLVPIGSAPAHVEPEILTPRDPSAPRLGELRVRPISYRGPSTTELLRGDRSRR
jgi:prevent-host-death family protein